jgi:vacuolar-type H+-ATPase subunit E/Vma4
MPAGSGPLLAQLRQDAAATVTARIADAHAEASRILATATTKRDRHRADVVSERERALARLREAARAETTQQTLVGVLTARAAFLDCVFAAGERRLEALAGAPDLSTRLRPLLAEALPFVDAAEAQGRCSGAARAAVAAALAALGRADMPIAVDDALPLGAIIRSRDGTVRVDATFGARLRRLRPTLSIEAVHLIEAPVP